MPILPSSLTSGGSPSFHTELTWDGLPGACADLQPASPHGSVWLLRYAWNIKHNARVLLEHAYSLRFNNTWQLNLACGPAAVSFHSVYQHGRGRAT